MASIEQQSPSTQSFVEIDSIKDGIVVLKNGGLRQIIIVTGVNFDLKSEEEQNLTLFAYQNFLNTLDFSLQLIVHSRKLNIDRYLGTLEELEVKEGNELLKNQIAEYRTFVGDFVAQSSIMTKTFFVVIPYDHAELAEASSGLLSFLPFGQKKSLAQNPASASRARNIQQLRQRTEQVIAGIQTIGLRAVPLNDEELIEFFYNLYNPEAVEKKGLTITQSSE